MNPSLTFGELSKLAVKHGTDKAPPLNSYTDVYDYFLLPIKEAATAICEIGIKKGASMKMFAEYFPNATIYGIDIEDKKSIDSGRLRTHVADQGSREQLRKFVERHPVLFDVILDDGGHRMDQQQISFAFLFSRLKPGGYYIIEDVHTSVLQGYDQNQNGSNTTLVMIERYIRTGKINSGYMTAAEIDYLNKNIVYANLLGINRVRWNPMTCIFKKK